MALDPSISLNVRPPVIPVPEIQSPLDRFAKVLSLRNLMTQGESGQLGLQTQQLQLQQQQQQMTDDMAIRNAYAANPNISDSDLIATAGPTRAIPIIKAKYDQLQQFYKAEKERSETLGSLAGAATDKDSAVRAVLEGVSRRAFALDPQKNSEIGRAMLDHLNTTGFNPAEFKEFQSRAMDAVQQHSAQIADAEEKRKQALAPFELSEKQDKATQTALDTAGRTAQLLTDPNQIPGFIAQLPPELQPRFKKLSVLPLAEFKQYAGMGATASKPGETIPLPAGVQTQRVEQAAAQGLAAAQAGIKAKDLNNEELADAIIKNPKLYPTLEQSKRDELQPLLARRGFTQFTTKPSDTELTALYNSQRNLDAVKAMQTEFASGKYDWITGPVLGHAKDIPWLGDQGKGLEAQMDELRSTVGDLIKGGTLRTSDIPVYEKMFPKTTDTTAVIKDKLDRLATRLSTDMGTYRQFLQSSGRMLPDAAPGAAPGATAPPAQAAPPPPKAGETVTGKGGRKYLFIGGDPKDQNNYKPWTAVQQ